MFMRLVDVPSKTLCTDNKYIDSREPKDSFFFAKINGTTKNMRITCPGLGNGGTLCPYGQDPLSKEDIACVWAYVMAVTGN